jgi:L-asparagine transporter-like permease
MSLSPREEEALATLEEALRADDPALAAAFGSTPWPAWSRSLIPVRHVVSLFAALLVLVVGTAVLGPRLGTLATGAATAVLVVPWMVVTVRSVGRAGAATARRSRRRFRGSAAPGIGPGQVSAGVVVLLVALATLPPVGQALLGLLVVSMVVPWLVLRVIRWRGGGTPR